MELQLHKIEFRASTELNCHGINYLQDKETLELVVFVVFLVMKAKQSDLRVHVVLVAPVLFLYM